MNDKYIIWFSWSFLQFIEERICLPAASQLERGATKPSLPTSSPRSAQLTSPSTPWQTVSWRLLPSTLETLTGGSWSEQRAGRLGAGLCCLCCQYHSPRWRWFRRWRRPPWGTWRTGFWLRHCLYQHPVLPTETWCRRRGPWPWFGRGVLCWWCPGQWSWSFILSFWCFWMEG